MKKQGAAFGEEELTRFKRIVRTRDETRAEADVLFGRTAVEQRKTERAAMEKLFTQFPAAQTMTPSLQKESSAKNVEAFFAKLATPNPTEAQKRYPELLKAAALPTPALNKKAPVFQGGTTPTSGPTQTQSILSRP